MKDDEKVSANDLKLFTNYMTNLLHIMKQYKCCESFYEKLNYMEYVIDDVLKSHLEDKNV